MATEKQIAANRANAQKSTGPRTEEGKSKSRMNAKRDGITGQVITLSAEDLPVFEKLKAELIADLAPQTVMERKLASSIAWDTWRLDRIRAAEMNIFALAADNPDEDEPDDDPALQSAISDATVFLTQARRLELNSLYEQRMTRSLHRNRAELQDLQAQRRRQYETDREEEVLLARLEDLKDKPYQAPAAPGRNGFVFSSEEISLAAERQRNLEAAQYVLNNKAPWVKYGSTGSGSPDLFAICPNGTSSGGIPAKIYGVSPESSAVRKHYFPEEFTKKRR